VASVAKVTLGTGIRVSYAEHGDGPEPVVVLLPGPTDSWRSYEPVLDRLPRDVHAIAVTQRGHGDSDKPETGYRVDDFAADVVSLLDALGIESPVLTGHSGSCLVARRVVLDHPDRVAGLILEASPTSLRNDAQLSEFVESVVSGLEDPIGRDFARSFLVDTSSGAVAPDLLDRLTDDLLEIPARVWHEMFAGLLQYEDLPRLGEIGAPTLLVWGDTDQLVSRTMQDRLMSLIPAAELIVYEGVGHTPRWEEPSRFADDIAAFVRKLRSARR
jgi:non-heme chloroperoxidase